jgi:hypothetical protein
VYLRGIDNTEIVHTVHERPAPTIPARTFHGTPRGSDEISDHAVAKDDLPDETQRQPLGYRELKATLDTIEEQASW